MDSSRHARRSLPEPPPEPIVALRVLGGLIITAGLAIMAIGVRSVVETGSAPDPFHGEGPGALADGASLVTWGAVVFTIGCYIWRAARGRGWRDRWGRVLIVAGYLLIGVAMDRAVHVAVGIWAATEDEITAVLGNVALAFLGWGIPGAFLVWLGVRMADEIVIMTAEMDIRKT